MAGAQHAHCSVLCAPVHRTHCSAASLQARDCWLLIAQQLDETAHNGARARGEASDRLRVR